MDRSLIQHFGLKAEGQRHEHIAAEADDNFQNLVKRFADRTQLATAVPGTFNPTNPLLPKGIMEAEFVVHVKMLHERMDELQALLARCASAQEAMHRDPALAPEDLSLELLAPEPEEEAEPGPDPHRAGAGRPGEAVELARMGGGGGGASLDTYAAAHEANAEAYSMKFHQSISRAWVQPGQVTYHKEAEERRHREVKNATLKELSATLESTMTTLPSMIRQLITATSTINGDMHKELVHTKLVKAKQRRAFLECRLRLHAAQRTIMETTARDQRMHSTQRRYYDAHMPCSRQAGHYIITAPPAALLEFENAFSADELSSLKAAPQPDVAPTDTPPTVALHIPYPR